MSKASGTEYKCDKCMDSGKIADDDDGSPWPAWSELPPGSDLAVRMGLVKPIPCPKCSPAPKISGSRRVWKRGGTEMVKKKAPLGLGYGELSTELIREIKYAIREVEAEWFEGKLSGYKPQHLSSAVIETTQNWYFKQHQELVDFAQRVKEQIKEKK